MHVVWKFSAPTWQLHSAGPSCREYREAAATRWSTGPRKDFAKKGIGGDTRRQGSAAAATAKTHVAG